MTTIQRSATRGALPGVIDLTASPYNADPTGTTAIDTALDLAIAAIGADGPTSPTGSSARHGGVIYLPPGYYRQAAAHTIAKNSIVIRGAGRQATQIFLDPAFPTATAAWNISGTSTVFDSRLESLTLNCNGVTGSIGVKTVNGQESCGLRGVRIRDFKEKGFYAIGTGQTSKPAEIVIHDCEFWASAGVTSTAYAIHVEDTAQSSYLSDTTLLTLASNTGGAAGVYLKTAAFHARNVHIEDYPDGFYVDTDASLTVNSVTSFNGVGGSAGHATISMPTTTNRVIASSINNGTGNILFDNRSGMTRGGSGFRYLHSYVVDYTNPNVFVNHSGGMDIRKTSSSNGAITALFIKDGTSSSATGSVQQWADSSTNIRAEMFSIGLLRLGLAANTTTNWTDGHLQLGPYHLWVDDTGRLRIKSGAPTSATDGTVVGTQT